jgi:hypothetical protein
MISRTKVQEKVGVMRELIPFFPKGDAAFDTVVEFLIETVHTEDKLRWLVTEACKSMEEFSMPALRRLLEDGSLTEADIERKRLDKADEDYEQKRALWKAEAAAAGLLGPPEELKLPYPIKLKSPYRRQLRAEAENKPKQKITEVSYINGDGFTIQRTVAPTLAELEAQLAQDMAETAAKTDEERESRQAEHDKKVAELERTVRERMKARTV